MIGQSVSCPCAANMKLSVTLRTKHSARTVSVSGKKRMTLTPAAAVHEKDSNPGLCYRSRRCPGSWQRREWRGPHFSSYLDCFSIPHSSTHPVLSVSIRLFPRVALPSLKTFLLPVSFFLPNSLFNTIPYPVPQHPQ